MLAINPTEAGTRQAAISKLKAGYVAVALSIQEAASDLSNQHVAGLLHKAVQAAHQGSGNYGAYIDHFGDDSSGDCIYSCNGDTMKAPYSIDSVGDTAHSASLDTENARQVSARTVYEDQADDDDNYAAMEEAFRAEGLYEALPLYERFISKDERGAADGADFAGKGKSYPILKPGDVMAAVHAMGRAGSKNVGTSTLKKNIIAIAKKKGWTKYLPQSWQGGDDSTEGREAIRTSKSGLKLVESAATLETIRVQEARADYEIKLIAPGKGSSAYYPKEVLQRDGPKVFKAGTHVYLNHATAAEEAARPEGDVRNLAGVLTTDAAYNESHAKGPGLYARMKVFADHAQTVEEKAPHVGMSIRAEGVAESGKMIDGKPVLKSLTGAESVDVVTRAGAGGMILTEAARHAANPQQQEVSGMDATELTALKESNARLLARALRGDAVQEADRILREAQLPEPSKERIIEAVTRGTLPQTATGDLDSAKFKESVETAAKEEARYVASITGAGRVFGMGAAAVESIDPKEAERRAAAAKEDDAETLSVFESLCGGNKAAAAIAAKGRAA